MLEVPMFETGKDKCKISRVMACEPSCAIFLSRAGQDPREAVCAKMRRVTRDERKAGERPDAASGPQPSHFRPQCGQLRGRELTLF